MSAFGRIVFHALVVRPFVFVVIGLRTSGRDRLPRRGPAIVVANHNSHLDTAVLSSLFPLTTLARVRPAAAADYFLRTRTMAWFSRTLMGIVSVSRRIERGVDPLAEVTRALDSGHIVLIYPEGTRGEPEAMTQMKKGVARLVETRPSVPVIPVHLRGLGRALPKGAWLPVPFFCDVTVGEEITWTGDRDSFMTRVRDAMRDLSESGFAAEWL